LTYYVEDNTFQDKSWIFDSDSTVHICSHKEMFNSLARKEEGIFKMVDNSTCKVIDTRTVNVTCIDETVHALEAIWYSLISIGLLDEKGYRTQVQQGVIMISQGDMIILKGEKCEGIYKLK